MKIIYKSFFSDKLIIRQLIILLVLLVFLYINVSFKGYVDNIISAKENNLLSRTIEVILKDNYSIKEFNSGDIEKIEQLNDTQNKYKIILKKSNDVDNFINNYRDYCVNINFTSNQTGISNILSFSQTFLSISLIIIFLIILIIIVINVCEILLNEQKQLSLYKLIGFSNFSIIKYFAIAFSFTYFLIYVFSITIYSCIIFLLNLIFTFMNLNFVSIYFLIIVFILIFILTLVILVILYFKIKKITPIYFQTMID